MNSEEVFSGASSLLSPLRTAAATDSSQKQQQPQCDSQQGEPSQSQEPQQQETSSEREEGDQQQHLELHADAQQQHPQHHNKEHEQHQRDKNRLDEQQQECQPKQAATGEQLQHALPHTQRVVPGKRQEDGAGLPRGGLCWRRSRRVASVRFNVPPSPSSDFATVLPPASSIYSHPPSPASVSSSAVAAAIGDACSLWPWAPPVSDGGAAAEGAFEGAETAEDAAADVTAADVATARDRVDWNRESRATDSPSGGSSESHQVGELRIARANVQLNLKGREGEEMPHDSVEYAMDEASSPLAGVRRIRRKENCHSADPAGAEDDVKEVGSCCGDAASQQYAAASRGCTSCGVLEQHRTAGWSSAAGADTGGDHTLAGHASHSTGEKTFSSAWPEGTVAASVAVPSLGIREAIASEKLADGWRGHAGSGYHKSSESSLSSGGWSDKERYDEDQQAWRLEKRDAVHALPHRLNRGGASAGFAAAAAKTSHLLSQAEGVSPAIPLGGSAVPEAGTAADAAPAVHVAALEAALAIDAAAAAAYPPDIRAAADNKAAAARRRGKAHILISSTATQNSREIFATAAAGSNGSPAAASAGSSVSSHVAEANPSSSAPAGQVVVAARRLFPLDGRSTQMTPEDAAQAAEDGLEYSSDWSVFRRSTRCSIVNAGAAVSFIKTAAGVWRSAPFRSRGAEQLWRTSTGGSLVRSLAAEHEAQQQQQQVERNFAFPSASGRSYYLNAAAVHAAATADAAAYHEQGPPMGKRERRTTSAAVLNGRRGTPAASDVRQKRTPSSRSVQDPRQHTYSADTADIAETARVPGTARSSAGRQLLTWWWGRRPHEQQQSSLLPPQSSSQQRVLKQRVLSQQRQELGQQMDQELLPLPNRQQRWSILLPAAAGGQQRSGSNSSNKEDATELERLLDLEGESDLCSKTEGGEALQKEDLEAIVCNIQQVKNFLVKKLRECEAALLATAKERDDMEASLKDLGRSLQEKEQQRDAAAKQLQAENLKQASEVKRLQEEVTTLRERATAQEQQIQQLQDEGVLLRAEVHDRVAASAVERESLLVVIKQLESDKATLEEQAQQQQQALAKSRQQLASALSRVDELEAFVPPALRGESPPSGSNSSSSRRSSSRRSSSTSPTRTCATTAAVESLRPAWWSRAGRDSPQRLLQQRPRPLQQQHRQQQHGSLSVCSRREVESRNSGNNSEPRKSVSIQALRTPPEKTSHSGDARRRSTTASHVLPPALSASLNVSRQQKEVQQRQQQSEQQKLRLVTSDNANAAADAPLRLPSSAVSAGGHSSSSSSTSPERENDAANKRKREDAQKTHREDKNAVSKAERGTIATAQLADSAGEADAGEAPRNAAETGGHAEKFKDAVAGGVTRMLQQLEQVLTVEERLIINETGVYTEDGVCLHKSGFLPSVSAGTHVALTPQQQKRIQEATQRPQQTKQQQQTKQRQHETKQQQKPQLQAKKGNERKLEKTRTDQMSGEEEEEHSISLQEKQQQRGSLMSNASSRRSHGRDLSLQQSSSERRQRQQREAGGGAGALSSDDLLVILSDAEETLKESEGNRSTSSARGCGGACGRSSSSVTASGAAGAAAGGSQRARTQRQQQEARSDSKSSSASQHLSRSSSAASVGGTVRDAVCSVLQAVHQRAVEVYIHPSSVLPTVPATGSSLQLAGNVLSSSAASGAAAEAATCGDATTTHRNITQQQQQQMQQQPRNGGIIQQTKSARGRSSAWEQLLQRHREAQQMPLFGSTPYPAATMNSTSRQPGNYSSSNDCHKPNTLKEGIAASNSTYLIDSAIDTETSTAADACCRIAGQQQTSQQQISQQQTQGEHDGNQNRNIVSGERLQAARGTLSNPEDQQQQLSAQQQQGSTQQQGFGQRQFSLLEDLSVQKQTETQRQRPDGDATPRDAGALLRDGQGDAKEQEYTEAAVVYTGGTQQEQAVVDASVETEEQQGLQGCRMRDKRWLQQQLGAEPVEAVLQQETEQQQLRIDEQRQEDKGEAKEEWQQQQRQMQSPEEEKGQQQSYMVLKRERKPEIGDANLKQEQGFSDSNDEQRTDDHVGGQEKCKTAQQHDDASSEDGRRQRSESKEEQAMVDTEQGEQTKAQLQEMKQHGDELSHSICTPLRDTEKECKTAVEPPQQRHQQKEVSVQQQAQEQYLQPREESHERTEKMQQKTGQESQSVQPQRQGTGQQNPRQQKAGQQRAKQYGQRRGGKSKGGGRQRRK